MRIRHDPTRVGRHRDHAIGEQDSFLDGVGDEDDREFGARPDVEKPVLQSFTRHGVQRAKRLVSDPGPVTSRPAAMTFVYCEARRPARRSPAGAFVPLAEQDCTLWSADMIAQAEALLSQAARSQTFGRFQTEAAIQSVPVQRARSGTTDLDALVLLHDLLAKHAPSLGALVSRAAVHGEAFGAEVGLRALDDLPDPMVHDYQPYWAVGTYLLHRCGPDADAARARAILLSTDPAIRNHLAARISPSDHPSAA